jgi:hypothetical protein
MTKILNIPSGRYVSFLSSANYDRINRVCNVSVIDIENSAYVCLESIECMLNKIISEIDSGNYYLQFYRPGKYFDSGRIETTHYSKGEFEIMYDSEKNGE